MTTPPNNTESIYRRGVSVAVFLLVVVGAAFAYQHFTGVYHLAIVKDGVLYRDGVRSSSEFKRTIARVAPKTVVCLVSDQEVAGAGTPQFKEEFDFLREKGIAVERIPISTNGWPTSDDVRHFLGIVAKPENQPVLVHCAQGVRRTGMMVAAFQQSVLRYNKERAKDEILTFGHTGQAIADIRRFIDAYDPGAQAVSADLK